MKYEVSILINCPVAEVFQYVTHVENHPQWQASAVENTQITPGPMGIGTEILHKGKWLGRRFQGTARVTEFEPNRKWAYQSLDGPFQLELHCSFAEAPGGTRLTMFVEGDDKGFFKMAGPILAGMAKRMQEEDLKRLKRVLETESNHMTNPDQIRK